MSSALPWHAVVAMVVGYLVLAAWAVLLGGVVFVSLVGRWLAHRRVKRAVRDLVGERTLAHTEIQPPEQWPRRES